MGGAVGDNGSSPAAMHLQSRTECKNETCVRQQPCCHCHEEESICLRLEERLQSSEFELDAGEAANQKTKSLAICCDLGDSGKAQACQSGDDEPSMNDEELQLEDDGSSINIPESSTDICRLCKRRVSSGRALGGHMRAHGSVSLEDGSGTSCCNGVDGKEQAGDGGGSSELDCSSSGLPVFFPKDIARVSLRALQGQPKDFDVGKQNLGMDQEEEKEHSAKSSTEAGEDAHGGADAHAVTTTHICEACEMEFQNAADLDQHRKVHPQYGLRSNPKRSRRFIDQDYTFDEATSSVPVKKTTSIFSEKARACTECGKEFSSWKALFGHMRCHPEREWRGIQPPDNASKQGSGSSSAPLPRRRKKPTSSNTPAAATVSTPVTTAAATGSRDLHTVCEPKEGQSQDMKMDFSDDDSDTESIEAAYMNGSMHPSFHGWMTGKRSKRTRQFVRSLQDACQHASDGTPSTTIPTEMKEEQDMANCLVMLACAGRTLRRTTSDQQLDKDSTSLECKDHGFQMDTKDCMETSTGPISPKNGTPVLPQAKYDRELERDMDGGSLCEENEEEFDGVDPGAGGCRLKYECTTCKRIFKSHQALGGHRASHKKVKGCFARTNMSTGLQEMQEDGITEEFLKSKELLSTFELQDTSQSEDWKETYLTKEDSEEMMSVARKTKGHECSICHRVFSSGQALGGHKRCHWGGAGTSSEIISVVSSNTKQPMLQLSHTPTFKEKILDLNLPAPIDDPDCVHDLAAPFLPAYVNRLAPTSSLASAERTIDFLVHRKTRNSLDILDDPTKLHDEDDECNLYSTEECVAPNQADEEVETSLMSTQNGVDLTSKTGLMEDGMDFSCTRYLRCNICDRLFTSMEAFCNHRKTHAPMMSSVPGLTPISA